MTRPSFHNRRAFLKAAAATTVASELAAPGSQAAAMEDEPPIIDTHQHMWDRQQFRLPWLEGNAQLDRDFVMADYLKAAEGLGVIHSVYMEVDVEPAQHAAEAGYVLDLCRRGGSPLIGAVIGGRPAAEGFKNDLVAFKNHPALKGVRQVLHSSATPAGYCLDPRFVAGIRLLGDLGLSFDICMRAAELGDATKLATACPNTQFILDHCGNPSVREPNRQAWQADIARLAGLKNVSCKVSGFIASAAPDPWKVDDLAPIVNHVLDSFGPDRVVFGGDWPVCTLAASLRQWVEALRTIIHDRPFADRKKLFHNNALKIYRLA